MLYNDTYYFYALNAQGDVTAILSVGGNVVVEYTYDAWGRVLSITGSKASTVGRYNPLRYRGYVYDNETELYYLQSRYYDPNWGRFINADNVLLAGDLHGNNQFAYCGNNPVAYEDSTGHSLDTVFDIISFGFSLKAVMDDPTDTNAWLALAFDALCLAVPGATGGGTIIRSLNKVDDALDLARAADRATGAVRAVDGIVDAARAADTATGVCFVAGTPILTDIGRSPIEEIQVGDLVWAADPETGEVALKPVVQTFVNETQELVHVHVNGEELVCTPGHPFYSPAKGWTAAIQLRAGDILLLVNGEYVVVEQIQHEILESPINVYNFEVGEFHTYYAGDLSVLVHNSCSQPGKLPLLSKKEISQLGGEKVTSILKREAGGSLSDLRINRQTGMVYSVRKGALFGNEIGYLEELIKLYNE